MRLASYILRGQKEKGSLQVGALGEAWGAGSGRQGEQQKPQSQWWTWGGSPATACTSYWRVSLGTTSLQIPSMLPIQHQPCDAAQMLRRGGGCGLGQCPCFIHKETAQR